MMTKDGGRRIDTSQGAVLVDAPSFEAVGAPQPDAPFAPELWAARGALGPVTAGRGAAWFLAAGREHWVLRHYRRGGLIARASRDCYLWCGERRVRAFREWRLLAYLSGLGLPVPRPIAAHYRRSGALYRCDLITQRITDAQPLSAVLGAAPLADNSWRAVGAAVARLHAAGADHADLNAHNILVGDAAGGAAGVISVIDFDRGRLRTPADWTRGNLARLHRSLVKITGSLPPDRFPAAAWESLLAGYESR